MYAALKKLIRIHKETPSLKSYFVKSILTAVPNVVASECKPNSMKYISFGHNDIFISKFAHS